MIEIVQGSVQYINVDYQDLGGDIPTGDLFFKEYRVMSVDPVSGLDLQLVQSTFSGATSAGTMLQFPIDTTYQLGRNEAQAYAQHAITFPLTITAAVNDTFNVVWSDAFMAANEFTPDSQTSIYTIDPGTYSTMADLLSEFENFEDQDSLEFSDFVEAYDNGGHKLGFRAYDEYAEMNGSVFQSGATHDALAAIGVDNNTAFAGGTGGYIPWPRGPYNFYAVLDNGSTDQNPWLGPIPLMVI